MSNKIIPLRRVSRRKHAKKMQQSRELSLQIGVDYSSQPSTTNVVMKLGGRILYRNVEEIQSKEYLSGGWTQKDGSRFRQLIQEAIEKGSAEPGLHPPYILSPNISPIIPPADSIGYWRSYEFITPETANP